MSSWFSFSRSEGFPTHYQDQHSPAHIDIITAGLICAFVILAISLFSILPAYTGSGKRWSYFSQVSISLLIGGIIMIGNYGHSWEVGHAHISSAYKSGTGAEIHGVLGLHIALRGVNITLRDGVPKDKFARKELKGETIDYNEHFSWKWTQGRFGFSIYAGQFARDYRASVIRGLPIPILQLAEYFTFDGEGIRFGRHYKTAGYYSHIMMWLSFPTWFIANILFCVVIRYAAMFLVATGLFQLIAICIWTFVRNVVELAVPFESGADSKHEVILTTHFGPDYYLVLVNGIVCVLLGAGIFFMDSIWPDEMCNFFGIDPLTIYDEYHLSKEEIETEKKRKRESMWQLQQHQHGALAGAGARVAYPSIVEEGPSTSAAAAAAGGSGQVGGGAGMGLGPESSVDDDEDDASVGETSRLILKRRTLGASKLFQKSFKLKEKPLIKPRGKPKVASRTPAAAPTTKLHQEYEMATARTPLLLATKAKPPLPGGGGALAVEEEEDDDDDDDSDYANYTPPVVKKVTVRLPSEYEADEPPAIPRRH